MLYAYRGSVYDSRDDEKLFDYATQGSGTLCGFTVYQMARELVLYEVQHFSDGNVAFNRILTIEGVFNRAVAGGLILENMIPQTLYELFRKYQMKLTGVEYEIIGRQEDATEN